MANDFLQVGLTSETRPSMSAFQFEQRNTGNNGWQGVAPANVLSNAAASISVNSQKITNVLDPTGAQDVATKNYVDTEAGVANSPTWLKGTATTADATPTNLLSAAYAMTTASMVTMLQATVIVKKADLSVIASWKITGTFLNTAGTITQIGDGTSNGANTIYEVGPPQMSVGTFAGSVAFTISGTNVQVQGTGVVATTYNWSARMRIDQD